MITLDFVRKRAESDAKSRGYYLNPDSAFLRDLIEGLKTNEERYTYPSCPCRMATGKLELDRDIICPCDYRDPDVEEFGACFCALYVSKDIVDGKKKLQPVLERRPPEKIARAMSFATGSAETKQPTEAGAQASPEAQNDWTSIGNGKMKFWYCKQCGYVVYREDPPYICPICKAKREMFAAISVGIAIRG